ncbi:MAG: hypothetical protein AAFY65_18800 [Pseudomonadota bacterium]
MNRFHLAAFLALATLQPAFAEPTSEPVWMMVQHDVADIAAWRDVFDSGLSTRQSAGELQFQILSMDGPPATVLAIFEWTSEESALAFVNDPAVRNAMASAGVISEPVISLHENDPRYWITSDDREAPATDTASGN